MFILDAELRSEEYCLKQKTLQNTVVSGNKNKDTDIKQAKNTVLKQETFAYSKQ